MCKVVVPKYVAEAIETLRKQGAGEYGILYFIEDDNAYSRFPKTRKWAFGRGGSPDLLMKAIVNGYEIEKTPEDKLRNYFEELPEYFDDKYISACMKTGIKRTLDILGITIEGINGEDD